jgi:dTDP-4-amino-4,6-dideoxygalactose transaminase
MTAQLGYAAFVCSDPRTTLETSDAVIPYQGNGRRLLSRLDEVLRGVASVVENAAETGIHTNGANVAAFEHRLAARLEVDAAVAVASGSSALRGVFEVLELPPGSEVIMPGLSFIMSAYAVSDAFAVTPDTRRIVKPGLVPVFVDVDPSTYTIDPAAVEAAVTDRTRAILAVHLLGQTADMRPLRALAEAHGLVLVEDAAQAQGAAYRDPVTNTVAEAGALGHFGCFSLSSVKTMGSMGGDAGAVSIPRAADEHVHDARARLRAWRNTGRTAQHRYEHAEWGIRARMDEYSAAECLAELDSLNGWIARRNTIAQRFTSALDGAALSAPAVGSGRRHSFYSYMVKAANASMRDRLLEAMRAARIATSDPFTVIADQPVYRTGRLPSRALALDVCRELEQTLVGVPCYPELTEPEIRRIETVLATPRVGRAPVSTL